MNKKVLFEGKVTLGDRVVDFRIYKNEGEDIKTHYSFETNPQVRNEDQLDFHLGETTRAMTLEDLLSRFSDTYQKEFTTIVEERPNHNF